ncbi:MAG: hypothetical protein GY858_10300 [Candidatus Omnitrophica bacterium]|nr:hypothetical protein [Candidatus Omnitrophota bacterium]
MACKEKCKRLSALCLFLSAIVFSSGVAFCEEIFSAQDSTFHVQTTNVNYYLNSLIGEGEYYADNFYDDYLLTLEGRPVVHFTKKLGNIIDFYFYVENPSNLEVVEKFFAANEVVINEVSPKIIPAFIEYSKLRPRYDKRGVYSDVSRIIEKVSQIAIEPMLTEHSREKLDGALYRYLCSNGVVRLKDITKRPELFSVLVDKFYMLSTTCFYRAWVAIDSAKPYILTAKKKALDKGRPFKAKVFACSTGEEVITYAIEFLEAGIRNFTILASDINDSSLRFAKNMKYSNASFEQLPLHAQKKLRKYFEKNKQLNIWEPKDPDFFETRIKFINHDILNDLPGNLDKNFAPPYDLVSILNVLLYLENDAIQGKKNYWKKLLYRDGGILILHDKNHSILRRKLGDKWGFDNFFIVSDWTNIRDVRMTPSIKVARYEDEYKIKSEINFMRLTHGYAQSGQRKKALVICEDYLRFSPYSFIALPLTLEHYILEKRFDDARKIIKKIARTYIYPERMLSSLASLEVDRKEEKFLSNLKTLYQDFFLNHKTDPKRYEKLFDSVRPTSKKWGELRLILKASSFTFLQRYYIANQDTENIDRITLKSLAVIKEVLKEDSRYLITGRFLNEISRRYARYCIEAGQLDKLLNFNNRAIALYEVNFPNSNYIYVTDGLAFLNLNNAVIYDTLGRYGNKFEVAVENALVQYEKVLRHKENLGMSNLRVLYREVGHCRLFRGKLNFRRGNIAKAKEDFSKTLIYFERGLEIDPVYGRELLKLRKELFTLAEVYDIPLKLRKK